MTYRTLKIAGCLLGGYSTIGAIIGTKEYWDMRHHEAHLDEINNPLWKEDVPITPEEFRSLRKFSLVYPIAIWPIIFSETYYEFYEGDWELQTQIEHDMDISNIWYWVLCRRHWKSTASEDLNFVQHLYKWSAVVHNSEHMKSIEDLLDRQRVDFRQQK